MKLYCTYMHVIYGLLTGTGLAFSKGSVNPFVCMLRKLNLSEVYWM